MTERGFYIRTWKRDAASGAYAVDKDTVSLEDNVTFGICRYKQCDGVELVGAVRSIYTETYAEADSARVWISDDGVRREQTSITLTLLWFGSDPMVSDGSNDDDTASDIERINAGYHAFLDAVGGRMVEYWDGYRQRRVLMYLKEAVTINSDIIKNVPYRQAQFKFTNVFGESFALDDDTITKWLASGGREG